MSFAGLLANFGNGAFRGYDEQRARAEAKKQADWNRAYREAMLGHKGEDLDFRRTSTARGQDLRERDLGLKSEAEKGRNRRFDVGQSVGISQTLARPMAEYAPGAAAQILGLPPEYAQHLEESSRVARTVRRQDEASRAGARSGSAAAARNEQTRRSREAQYRTGQALQGKGEMPEKPFYPGTAGRPSAEKLEDAGIATEKTVISQVLRMVRAGEDVPAGLQQSAVRARARQLGVNINALSPAEAAQLEEEIAAQLGLAGE